MKFIKPINLCLVSSEIHLNLLTTCSRKITAPHPLILLHAASLTGISPVHQLIFLAVHPVYLYRHELRGMPLSTEFAAENNKKRSKQEEEYMHQGKGLGSVDHAP